MYKELKLDKSIMELDLKESQELLLKLLNIIETQAKQLSEMQVEIQNLKDENALLKGGNPKPKFKIPKSKSKNISSERERKENKTWDKSSKKDNLPIDKEEICLVDKEELPGDAIFMGYEDVVVQGIELKRKNVKYSREKYYSPSLNKTYLGKFTEEYIGGFSKEIHGLAICLKFACNVSEPKILSFMGHLGISMSSGTLSNILLKKHSESFLKEKEDIVSSALNYSDYHQSDTTQSTVNGEKHHTHVLCNENYTSYSTKETKSRLSIIDVLRQDKAREYLFDNKAFDLMKILKVSAKSINFLKTKINIAGNILSEVEANNLVKGLKKDKTILECAYISAYQKEENSVKVLITDDAPQYNLITNNSALCWIHEGRHYKKLSPIIEINREKLNEFLSQFWDYYKELKLYKENPSIETARELEKTFDNLFSTKTGYDLLDERISKTLAKKSQLLLVLDYPDIPLHNNVSELGVRQQVRYRDISLQTKNEQGTKVKDAMLTLVETAKKLKVSIWDYLLDRINETFELTSLAEIIKQKANSINFST